MRIETFEMERMQSLYWHAVDYDLSESGVQPLSIRELMRGRASTEELADIALGYPLSEGSHVARERIASWYPSCDADNVTVVNGGSEANFLALWTLLEPDGRLAFMVPNYMEGWGLGRHFADGADAFSLRLRRDGGRTRWELDVDELDRAVTQRTSVVMVCHPNNPTGHVLSPEEMRAVVDAAARVGAWVVADEIYRGAEVEREDASPTFWGGYDRVVVTSGLSKAFGMPGLRLGWIVAPPEVVREIWIRHDYTTLSPGIVSDRLCEIAMEPATREWILARTRSIIRSQLPPLEDWIRSHDDLFPQASYARPHAGAIAYVEYSLPLSSTDLVERVRAEQSVLLVPGDMFGLGRGIRIGFGYDLERTLRGLDRVAAALRAADIDEVSASPPRSA
jgi:aspartate/methionine/tyrosine aminotransferase